MDQYQLANWMAVYQRTVKAGLEEMDRQIAAILGGKGAENVASARTTGNTENQARRFPEGITIPDALGLAGAIAELQVSNVLLTRGHHVYRALVGNGPFDLVVAIAGQLFRVEVKSVRAKANGELVYKAKNALDPSKYDILAQVLSTGAIVFSPPLDEIEAIANARKGR